MNEHSCGSPADGKEVEGTKSDDGNTNGVVCPKCKHEFPAEGKNNGEADGNAQAAKAAGADASKGTPAANTRKRAIPLWWCKEVEDALQVKYKTRNRYKRTGRNADWIEYKKARAHARYIVRNAKNDYEESLQTVIRRSPSPEKDGASVSSLENKSDLPENMDTAEKKVESGKDTPSDSVREAGDAEASGGT